MTIDRKEPQHDFYEPSPHPGDSAPRWTLPDGSGTSYSLKNLIKENDHVVLTVYRGHW